MKRIAFFLSTVALLSGCGPKPASVPDFVLNPPKEKGKLFGAAEAEKKTFEMAKTIADNRACREVARQLSQRVAEVVKDFQEQSGDASVKAEYQEFSQVVGRTLTDVDLTGCSVQRREMSELASGDVKVWTLAALDAEQAIAAARGAMAAHKAKISAEQAFKDLDVLLDKKLRD